MPPVRIWASFYPRPKRKADQRLRFWGQGSNRQHTTSLEILIAGYEDLFEKAWNHHRSPEITVEEVWVLQKDDWIGWLDDGMLKFLVPLVLGKENVGGVSCNFLVQKHALGSNGDISHATVCAVLFLFAHNVSRSSNNYLDKRLCAHSNYELRMCVHARVHVST